MITPTTLNTYVLPVGRAVLSQQVRQWRDSPDFQTSANSAIAVELYNELIAPLKTLLTTPHLIIVPHGPLHYVPFGALSDGKQFLAETYVVSLLPSASTLYYIQTNAQHPLTNPLVLGNPDGTLRFAEQEARAIAVLYNVQPLLGAQASEQALHAQAIQSGILHIAAHSNYDPVRPLASYLALSAAGGDDGRLQAEEVYDLKLGKAGLVVLSACDTNVGAISDGDEVVGLTRAFLFAGTPTVVSSLWNVDDQASAQLMERFYQHLREGRGKAQALQQAQMDIRLQHPEPYYWAGFVLSGDAGALPTSLPWWWFTIGGLALVGLVALATVLLVRHTRRGQEGPQATLVPSHTVDQVESLAETNPSSTPDDLRASLLATVPAERAELSTPLAPAPDHDGQASETS